MSKPLGGNGDRILLALNILLLAGLAGLVFGPRGVVGKRVTHWWQARRAAKYASTNWQAIVDGAPRLDTATAPVSIVVFSDYECPFCRQERAVLLDFRAHHPRLGISLRQFPLPSHPHARAAAIAAVCGAEQGHFQDMNAALFESAGWLVSEDWWSVAKQAGVDDSARFQACLSGPHASMIVDSDIAVGRRLNITGTPTFVSRKHNYAGAVPVQVLEELAGDSR